MNKIDKTAIIGEHVLMGDNNVILPYTIIYDGVELGNNNVIGSHAVIGCPATDTKKITPHVEDVCVHIGDNNVIREFCIVERPCYEQKSVIQNDVFLMQGVHLSHDNILQDHVVVTNQCVLGGIAKILEGANLGMGCTINQYTIIGQYSMVATGAPCMKNVKPFSRHIPNKPISVNVYALKKYGLMEYLEEITAYVMDGVMPVSPKIRAMVSEFDEWVAVYGHETY
jgi:UDP-N-acetylglucosamine acyltransferase